MGHFCYLAIETSLIFFILVFSLTSEGAVEIFKGDFADMFAKFSLLMLMGGRATPSSMHLFIFYYDPVTPSVEGKRLRYTNYLTFPPYLVDDY